MHAGLPPVKKRSPFESDKIVNGRTVKKNRTPLFATPILLLGLPLLGILSAGFPVQRYLEFPPKTLYIHPAGFSWPLFVFYSLVFSAMVLPILVVAGRALFRSRTPAVFRNGFPWWGWAGLALNGVSWFVAWTRFDFLAFIQPHTFFPLWFSYILVINALRFRRDGTCMLTRRPLYFCLLFPASAVFWWFFEFLNRFVQNWYYLGDAYGPLEYVGLASLSFSTVLPAVLGTRDWLLGARWIREGFVFESVALPHLKKGAFVLFLFSAFGLFGIGIWPNLLFPMLWVSPLLIFLSLQVLTGDESILSFLFQGDFRPIVSAALAALICGVFWEMWNFYSLAKWVYRVPFVHRFEIFEMPILGYAGYLPFGLECAVAGELLDRALTKPFRYLFPPRLG